MIIGFLLRTVWKAIGAAVHLLAIAFKIVYNILKFLHVRVLALYLIVCAAVQLIAHPFAGEAVTYFWLGLGLCVMITVFSWSRSIRKKRRKKERERAPEIKKEPEPEEEPPQEKVRYPRYFDAEGREGYIFAEFKDRFELYRREGNKYILERVDKKERA